MIPEPAAGVLAVAGVALIAVACVVGFTGRNRRRRARTGFWIALAGTACEAASLLGYGIHHMHP